MNTDQAAAPSTTHTHASVTRGESARAIPAHWYGITITSFVGQGYVITASPAIGGVEATVLYNSTTGDEVQVNRWMCECIMGKDSF